ncbi:hypothetical protein PHYSODRAFT_384264, partial [Phytophthora sojae]
SAQQFVEVEGGTTFTLAPATAHRYSLSLRSGKLRVWLENCDTKKQWCTSDLALENYVNPSNVIPDAAASDYFFRTLLEKEVTSADEFPRTFKRIKGDVFRLEITMKFQVLMRSWVATY